MTDLERHLLGLEFALGSKYGKVVRLRVSLGNRGDAVELLDRQVKFCVSIGPGIAGAGPNHFGAAVTAPIGEDLPGLQGLSRASDFPLGCVGTQQQNELLRWVAESYDALYEEWKDRRQGLREAQEARESLRAAEELARKERVAVALEEYEASKARLELARLAEEQKRAREAEARAREREARRSVLLPQVDIALRTSLLAPEEHLPGDVLAGLEPGDVDDRRAAFVRSWMSERFALQLDQEQALAASTLSGNVKVTARAGSGKTRVLTAHALALQQLLGEPADSILVLAFNNRAAAEAAARLREHVQTPPHVMDFHAFAYAVTQPQEQLLRDDGSTGADPLSRVVQAIVDEELVDPAFKCTVQALTLANFQEDLEERVRDRSDPEAELIRALRHSLSLETLDGTFVKSRGERLIANTLFTWGIPYRYEWSHRWNGQSYRPDFTVAQGRGGIVIEYFGFAGEPGYDAQAELKREHWAGEKAWTLLEYTPADLSTGRAAFSARLLDDLRSLGVALNRRTDEELWAAAQRRDPSSFARMVADFVARCQLQNLDPKALRDRIKQHQPLTPSEEMFLAVAPRLLARYQEMLRRTEQIDFSSLLWRAIGLIRAGKTAFTRGADRRLIDLSMIRHVLVDEFQDFSEPLYQLVDAIRSVNPRVRFFCVGDDWQAIYGFAGADPTFFRDFDSRFPAAVHRRLRTSYRSGDRILAVGNEIMGNRAEAVSAPSTPPAEAWVCHVDGFRPMRLQQAEFGSDHLTPVVLGLVRHMVADGRHVTLLARRNDLPSTTPGRAAFRASLPLATFGESIRRCLPREVRDRVRWSTVHKMKGLESDAIIVLDGTRYSFPLIHPNWVFTRVLGDGIERIADEERRLLYVAVTRARRSVCILTDGRAISPYLQPAVEAKLMTEAPAWLLHSGGPSQGQFVEIRAYDNAPPQLSLGNLGFQFDKSAGYWWRHVSASQFSPTGLTGQPWVQMCRRVEAWSADGTALVDVPPRAAAMTSQREQPEN